MTLGAKKGYEISSYNALRLRGIATYRNVMQESRLESANNLQNKNFG
jgi:hypothetical protein